MWIVSEQSFLVDSLDPLQIDFVKVITNLRRHVDLIHSRVLIVLRRFFDDSSKLIFWRKRQIRCYSLISKHYKEVQHENRYRASSYCLIPVLVSDCFAQPFCDGIPADCDFCLQRAECFFCEGIYLLRMM
jgi:hypothetical protein